MHLHATGPALLSFLPRLFGVPTVATVQGLDWRREKWGPGRPVRAPDRRARSGRAADAHDRRLSGAAGSLPRGVRASSRSTCRTASRPLRPTRERVPIEGLEPDRYILFLGRLVPEKHVHTLISAYRKVDTDVPLVIAGPSSHSPEYVAELKRLAADDPRVRLLGPRYGGEKTWLMGNAMAFVQPSSIEGLPIALLEALASARFPIVSDIPENLEPVTVEGEQWASRSASETSTTSPSALSAAIERDDREEVGAQLRDHVQPDLRLGAHRRARPIACTRQSARLRPGSRSSNERADPRRRRRVVQQQRRPR